MDSAPRYPYDVTPRADPDYTPDRPNFISSDSFNSEDPSQASSFAAQPVYHPHHQWRSQDVSQPNYAAHAQPSRRHSHERYSTTEQHVPFNPNQRPLAQYEQGLPSYGPGQPGPSTTQDGYFRQENSQSTFHGPICDLDISKLTSHCLSVRVNPHQPTLSLHYPADYGAAPDVVSYPSTIQAPYVPQASPAGYAIPPSSRPMQGRRYSSSGQYPQQQQSQQQYPQYHPNSSQQQQQHHHQPSYDSYASSGCMAQPHYESGQIAITDPSYTTGRPSASEEWQSPIHQPIPQAPAGILGTSPHHGQMAADLRSYRAYPLTPYREPMQSIQSASAPSTPTLNADAIMRSSIDTTRFSSQSQSSSEEFQLRSEEGADDLRSPVEDRQGGEGEGSPPPPPKPKRRRADPTQLRILNEVYSRTAFPNTDERSDLAKQLNMTPRQVQIW